MDFGVLFGCVDINSSWHGGLLCLCHMQDQKVLNIAGMINSSTFLSINISLKTLHTSITLCVDNG